MARKKAHSNPPHYDLSDRAQRVLHALVRAYIHEGQPVGSKNLATAAGLDVSAATVRNIMADLEEHGFLRSPHTSSGRIPTAQGYRLFVDSLVTARPVERLDLGELDLKQLGLESLQQELGENQDTQHLVARVSEYLSGMTRLAGIVTLPRRQDAEVRRVEFLPLSEKRVLAVVVTSDQEVQNRILELPRRFSGDELQHVANYLNEEFRGKTLAEVRRGLLQSMRDVRRTMDRMMRNAVEMAERVFTEEAEESGYVLMGETNLMNFDELADVNRLRELFEAFNRKRDILHLLDQCLTADGVQIFIGEESGYEALGECSVVTSTYSVNDRAVGVLGVIGPTRIHYERVIPVVDITAKLLGAALNSRH